MNGTLMMYRDQYGVIAWARTVRELRQQFGGTLSKMYIDRGGRTIHVGYVLGSHWFTAFEPMERPA